MYYAGLLFASSVLAPATVTDLVAPTPAEFRALITSGRLHAGANETKVVLGKMILAAFLADVNTSVFEEALETLKRG
jgi:hypothetical protein